MDLVVSKNIIQNNVNLAHISGQIISSDNSIQIKDQSISYTENLLPIYTESRQCQSINAGVLDISNVSLSTKITSEYNFIRETAETIPLWLSYSAINPLYNNNISILSIQHTTVSNKYKYTYDYSDFDSKSITCRNTFNITYGSNTIGSANYSIDMGKKQIIFEKNQYDSFFVDSDIVIQYSIIPNDIVIEDNLGQQIDKKYIRIETNKFPDNDNLFILKVYIANVLNENRTYFIKYPSYDIELDKPITVTETINPKDIYSKMNTIAGDSRDYIYSIDESTFNINTNIQDNWPVVFVKYPRSRNSKISLIEPIDLPHESPWFIEVSSDKFIKDGLTYRLLEEDEQFNNNNPFSIYSTETSIRKIDSATLKTNHNNLYVLYNNKNEPKNITIINNNNDITSYIEYIDESRGIIKLRKDVNISQDSNRIHYQYKVNNVQYNNINVNPYRKFSSSNDDIISKYVVIYIVPEEKLITEKNRSIFHLLVYKRSDSIDNPKSYEVSIDNAYSYIESGEVSEQISEYLLDPNDSLNAVILGYVSVGNVTTPESIEIHDIRRRGGGISVTNYINELNVAPERQYLDIAQWNGYTYDISNAAIVTITNNVKYRIMDDLSKFDTHAQRMIRDYPQQFNIEMYAESYIENIVKKYLNAACHYTIKYVDTIDE